MKIKILCVCSALAKGELTDTGHMIKEIMSASEKYATTIGDEVKAELVFLAEDKIKFGCTHCGWCLEKQTADAFCSIDDALSKKIYPKIIEADALILETPVYTGMRWLMASFMSRLYALSEGGYYGYSSAFGDGSSGILKNKVLAAVSGGGVRYNDIETFMSSELFFALPFGMIPVTGPINGRSGISGVPAAKAKEFAIVAKSIGMRVVEVSRLIKAGKTALKNFPAYI